MKKINLVVAFVACFLAASAQNWSGSTPGNIYYNQGNVGIGTSNPAEQLEVSGLLKINRANNQDNNSPGFVGVSNDDFLYDGEYINRYGFGFHGYQDGTTSFVDPLNTYIAGYFGIDFFTTNNNRMRISHTGNVGIGVVTPFSGTGNYGLHIDRGAHSSLLIGNPVSGYGGIIQTSDGRERVFIGANLYDDQSGSWSSFKTGKGSAGISIIADEGDWGTFIDLITSQSDGHYNRSMGILGNGNIGIGVNSPNEKLVVDGKIRSEEIIVEVVNGPDYVFESNYKLPTLLETKEFISANKHLPEIPSAKEMETNGINLGDINMKLLKKIEELTLHLIEQNERVKILEKEVIILKKK